MFFFGTKTQSDSNVRDHPKLATGVAATRFTILTSISKMLPVVVLNLNAKYSSSTGYFTSISHWATHELVIL